MLTTLRPLFVNENIGGNATMHLHLRSALDSHHPDVEAQFLDVPRRGLGRRIAGGAVPGLARLDLDLAALRGQLAVSAHVRRQLRRWPTSYDALHIYTHNAALLSADLLRAVPSVVALDATTKQSAQLLPYRRPTRFTDQAARPAMALEKKVYDAADVIVAKSAWAERSLRDDYDIDPDRIRVIRYGIQLPKLPVVPRDPALIVFVGRSMTRKGGWLLLEAWRRRLRKEARLLLVTPEPVAPEPGLTVVSDLRAGDPRLLELVAGAAVLAFPSTGDTFGYAALEAMAVETPVVAARAAAIEEIVADGETGTLVEPHEADELAAALAAYLGDPDRARRAGRAARQRVREHFDASTTTAQVVELLRSLRRDLAASTS